MDSPNVKTEKATEITVAKGLNIETKTGPRFFMAHPLKLTHAPLTIPPCQIFNSTRFYNQTKLIIKAMKKKSFFNLPKEKN